MSKTKEIIFRRGREQVQIPEPHVGIQRYKTLNVLGIKLQDNLHMNEHVDDLIGECANNLYAMNVLRAHGMRKEGLEEVFMQGKNLVQNNVCFSCLVGVGQSTRYRPY